MVMSINENRVLCTLQPVKVTDCDEMATVRRGLDDIRHLQDYADAQAGGPGKGFFQIVTDPYEARRVINAGPDGGRAGDRGLRAVRLPRAGRAARATAAKVDRELDDLYKRGVRSALLLNKYDNPLAGTRFDSGAPGHADQRRQPRQRRAASGARRRAPGRCATTRSRSPTRASSPPCTALTGVTLPPPPLYPQAPHCNTRGLTDLGAHTVERADGQAHDRQPRPHEPEGGRRRR